MDSPRLRTPMLSMHDWQTLQQLHTLTPVPAAPPFPRTYSSMEELAAPRGEWWAPQSPTGVGNWVGPDQSDLSPPCFMLNRFGSTGLNLTLSLKKLCLVVLVRSVKTGLNLTLNYTVPSLDRVAISLTHIFDQRKSKYYNHVKFITY
jgi:hypothetical protein